MHHNSFRRRYSSKEIECLHARLAIILLLGLAVKKSRICARSYNMSRSVGRGVLCRVSTSPLRRYRTRRAAVVVPCARAVCYLRADVLLSFYTRIALESACRGLRSRFRDLRTCISLYNNHQCGKVRQYIMLGVAGTSSLDVRSRHLRVAWNGIEAVD